MNKQYKLLATVLVVLGFVLFYLFALNENKQMEVAETVSHEAELEYKNKFYNLNFETNSKITGTVVKNILCEIEGESKISLSELVKEKPKLVFRYSNINCKTCFEAQLELINKLFENSEDVIILCSYNISRDFLVFKKMNKIKVPIYRIPKEDMEWEINNPFYFLLNKSMSISNIYIPDKKYQQMSLQYLLSMQKLINAK